MKTVYNIQGLRAVAAYMVVAYHMAHNMQNQFGVPIDLWALSSGVDVFFVISGFVMVYVTAWGKTTRALEFLSSRARRIYPIYWLVTIVMVSLTLVGFRPVGVKAWDGLDLLTSLVLFPDVRADGYDAPIVTVAWTLVYEMLFYFVFAVCLPVRSVLRRVVLVSLVFGSLSCSRLLGTPDIYALDVYTRPIVLEFCAGCWLGWWFLREGRWSQSALGLGALCLLTLGTAAIVMANLLMSDFTSTSHLRALWFGLPATAIVASALMAERAGWFSRHRILMLLGAASYATYLTHQLVIQCVSIAVKRLAPAEALWGAGVAAVTMIGAIVVTGLGLHLYVELPLAKRLRWLRARSQSEALQRAGEASAAPASEQP